ncbi:hypothetical protein ACNKHM_12315 [Shigella sonnei]
MIDLETFYMVINHETKTPPYGEGRRLALDFDLSTSSITLFGGISIYLCPQRITLQQQVQLAAQTQTTAFARGSTTHAT